MRIFMSRWANRELAHLTCQPVGISRGTPRFPTGYRYRQARELAPNNETWAQRDMEAFRLSYLRQLEEIGLDTIVGRLEEIGREARGLPLVLLCYEDVTKPGEWCHREHLSAWLRERGVEIRELEPGDLPQREDVPEPKLFDHREERT